MTTSQSTLRKRNLTAAKRSLKLILEGAQAHLDILDNGEVPEGSFAPSFTKYLEALGNLRVLDALGEAVSDNGTVEVSVEALTGLVELLRASEVGYAIQDAEEGSPLSDIIAVTGTGEPAEEAS